MNDRISQKVSAFFAAYPAHSYDKKQVLIQAGSNPSGVFCIEEGQVRQYDITERGDEVVVNVFKASAFFPVSWALNKTPNHYFFETTAPTIVRRAPADAVVAFLHKHPDVALDLLSRVCKGTDGLLRRMAHIMGGTAHTRLAFELVTECKRFGEHKAGGSYKLPLNESEIGARAGLSRETVSRGMKALKQTGLIEVTQGGIIITDLAKLEAKLGSSL